MWSSRTPRPRRPGSRLHRGVIDLPQSASRRILLRKLAAFGLIALIGTSLRTAERPAAGPVSIAAVSAPVPSGLRAVPGTPALRRVGNGEIRLASLGGTPVAGDAEECVVRTADAWDDTTGRLVGSWEDDYYGHRVMTLRPDGSGTMLVEIKGPAKLIVGSKLTFHVEWSVMQGKLEIRTTGGEPANKVAMITRTYGDRALQEILDLSANELSLRDTDDGDEFLWRRLQPTLAPAN